MYIKKAAGPRCVTLGDGRVMTQADLPPLDTQRWVASRKRAVVDAVKSGLLSGEDACRRYGLSEEELDGWQAALESHGVAALKTTALQKFRQP